MDYAVTWCRMHFNPIIIGYLLFSPIPVYSHHLPLSPPPVSPDLTTAPLIHLDFCREDF